MIVYNNRFRGPHEYDKFALNILSFHNAVASLETHEVRGVADNFVTLKSIQADIDNAFSLFVGPDGICEKAYITAIKERMCIK